MGVQNLYWIVQKGGRTVEFTRTQPCPSVLSEQEIGMSLLLNPEAAARELSISRTALYELMANCRIDSIKIGRSRRIPRQALDAYVARLVADQCEDSSSSRSDD